MFKHIAARVKAFLHRDRIDEELDDEVRFHVEMETRANLARGMTPTEARRVALRDLGGVTQTREAVRDVRAPWYDSLAQDVRYALRSFRKNPGFTVVAVLTLALGIGANTAIFSLVDAILFRPLPYGDPGRLVWIMGYTPRTGTVASVISQQEFDEIGLHHRGFDRVSCSDWSGPSFTKTGVDADVVLRATAVCTDLLDVLRVRPILGRGFVAGEAVKDNDNVAVLTHATWQKLLAGDAGIVGRTVAFKERTIRIVGVLPPGFVLAPMLSSQPDMVVPAVRVVSARARAVAVGRLKPGVSVAQAEAELDGLDRGLQAAEGGKPWQRRMRIVGLQAAMFWGIRPLSFVLFAAAGLILLLATANLANLLFARGSWRERELAIRAAVGASRRRLVRQLLVEGLLLSCAGGALGLALAYSTFGALYAQVPSKAFRVLPAGVDRRVLLFTLLVSILTGLASAVLPAIRLTRPNLTWSLQEGRRRGSAGRARGVRGAALVVAQMAVVVVVLTAAGLMLNSLIRALTMDLGVRADKVIQVGARPPRTVWSSPAGTAAFYRDLMASLADVRGVHRVAGVCFLTVGGSSGPFDEMLRDGPRERRGVRYLITAGYFDVLGIAVRKGRTFTAQEIDDAAPLAVVNETAARQLWPGEDAVGKWFQTGKEPPREVIGVVADTRDAYRRPVQAALYVAPDPASPVPLDLVVLADSDVAAVEKALRARLGAPTGPGSVEIVALADVLRETTVGERFQTLLLALFAGLALLLAAVGIAGIVGYTVAQRTREIGIRLALGSTPLRVGALIVHQALVPVALGAAVGIAAAFAVTRLLTTLLFQVKPTDPVTFAVAVAALLLVAVLASLLPARRAARVNPIEALRAE